MSEQIMRDDGEWQMLLDKVGDEIANLKAEVERLWGLVEGTILNLQSAQFAFGEKDSLNAERIVDKVVTYLQEQTND